MSVPDPDYILRVPDHSPISSLQHEEDENYLLSGHQSGTILVRFWGHGRLSKSELIYVNCTSNVSVCVRVFLLGFDFTSVCSSVIVEMFFLLLCKGMGLEDKKSCSEHNGPPRHTSLNLNENPERRHYFSG